METAPPPQEPDAAPVVDAPPPPPPEIEVTMIAYPEAIARGDGTHRVAFVAYQEGDGAWRPIAKYEGLAREAPLHQVP